MNHLTVRRALCAALCALACSAPVLAEEHGGHAPHWGYTGAESPEHWNTLSPAFATCEKGARQTPIDIVPTEDQALAPIEFHYAVGGREEVNNGHTIQINYEQGSFIRLDGKDYALKQFHFHTPSENHVQGHAYPMEGHFVHKAVDGQLAVVAVMFEEGAQNEALATAWTDMPEHGGRYHELLTRASAAALLPAAHEYYRFEGSLTTPPCTEGVQWVVMKQPVTASRKQIMTFAQIMGHPNNRPLQPRNARAVAE